MLQSLFAVQDPVVQRALVEPANLGYIKNVLGLSELVIPGEDSRNKQLREIQQLLASAPIVVAAPASRRRARRELQRNKTSHQSPSPVTADPPQRPRRSTPRRPRHRIRGVQTLGQLRRRPGRPHDQPDRLRQRPRPRRSPPPRHASDANGPSSDVGVRNGSADAREEQMIRSEPCVTSCLVSRPTLAAGSARRSCRRNAADCRNSPVRCGIHRHGSRRR